MDFADMCAMTNLNSHDFNLTLERLGGMRNALNALLGAARVGAVAGGCNGSADQRKGCSGIRNAHHAG